LAKLRRNLVPVNDHQIEFPVEAGNQFPRLMIAVETPQYVASGHRDIVLDKLNLDAGFTIQLFVV
jgi:hypothetical protein